MCLSVCLFPTLQRWSVNVKHPSLYFFVSAPISLFFWFVPHVPICMFVSNVAAVAGSRQTPISLFFCFCIHLFSFLVCATCAYLYVCFRRCSGGRFTSNTHVFIFWFVPHVPVSMFVSDITAVVNSCRAPISLFFCFCHMCLFGMFAAI